MEKLTKMMASMATKNDLDDLKTNIEANTKIIVAEAVDPIKDEMVDIKARISKLEETPQTSSASGGGVGGGNTVSRDLQKQMDEMKENMKNMDIPTDPKLTSTTIVIGGFVNFTSLSDASKWLDDFLWEAYAPTPVEIFIRRADGEYSGVFFAKFASPTDRIKALGVLKSKLAEVGDKTKWANVDLPTEIQAPEKFALGVKKQLVQWGTYTAASIRVEVEGPSKIIKAQGKEILTVTCKDRVLVYDWEDTWKGWDEFHGSAEIKTLTEKCNKLLGGGRERGR